MDNSKIGNIIYNLRRGKGLTQIQLAQMLNISDKAVSKWERGLGCPDVSLLPDISKILNISIETLLSGNITDNDFVGGNMKKLKYFVCPTCGNINLCTGNSEIICCGKKLNTLEAKKPDGNHDINIEQIEDDWYMTSDHPMLKEHYISFVVFATGDKLQLTKQYPEWNFEVRIPKRSHGTLLWYCTNDGLFYKNI